ncbi:MAG: hypothetical protein ACRCWG_13645 [Sarcina sp.]
MKKIIGIFLMLILQGLMYIFAAVIYQEVRSDAIEVLGLILFTVSVDVIGAIFIIDNFFCKVD